MSYSFSVWVSYGILAITCIVVIYRFVTLLRQRSFWELPIFLAGSALAVIGAFSVTLYLQNIPIINELGEKFGLSRSISAIPERIKDGDDIVINGQTFRLNFIDAPELGQCCKRAEGEWKDCGALAQKKLLEKIDGKQVNCSWYKIDRYNRPLATCFIGETNLNGWMVKNGFAFSYREKKKGRYEPKPIYLKHENEAKLAKVGLHNHIELMLPHQYRDKYGRRQQYPNCD